MKLISYLKLDSISSQIWWPYTNGKNINMHIYFIESQAALEFY